MSPLVDHAKATRGVLNAVAAIAGSPGLSDAALSAHLQNKGYSAVQAEKLTVFVPSAFACALLHKMGVSLASHYIAVARDGSDVTLPIGDEHYYTAALGIAHHTLEHGWSDTLPRLVFEAVIARSAEMDAANGALNAGDSIAGGRLNPLRVLSFSAEAARED
jgi:hypothetical protein